MCDCMSIHITQFTYMIESTVDGILFQFRTITYSATMSILYVLVHICVHFYLNLGAEFLVYREWQTIFQIFSSNPYSHQ